MARRVAAGTATIVLDSEGLSKAAASDARVGALLKTALEEQARVVVSAVTLTEVLRGGARDANVHRRLGQFTRLPVTEELGRAAGELLGRTGGSNTVDAVVAATAIAQQPGRVFMLTSDPADLTRLTEGHPDVRVQHV